MTTGLSTDPEKSHLLTQAIALAERSSGTGGPPRGEVGPLLHAYYRHVSIDDVGDRSAEELYGALVSHYRTADERPQGTASVHVFTPTLAEHGWSAGGHSVVEVVTDDMPFLVDSVVMELARQQRDVHLVIHPQFDVTRDVTGKLEEIDCPDNESAEPARGCRARVVDARRDQPDRSRRGRRRDRRGRAARAARRPRVGRGLGPDAPAGRGDRRGAAGRPARRDLRRRARARCRLPRLARRRPLHLPRLPRVPPRARRRRATTSAACPAPATASCAPTPTWPRRPASCRPRWPNAPASSTLLVLTKANSRSTVHRPAYLDYVGVKTFDAAGEVVGERRFLGPVLQRGLHRVGLAHPAAAREGEGRPPAGRSRSPQPRRQGPDRHARDLPARRAVPDPGRRARHRWPTRVMETRGRRQLRVFVRRDTYGRYVSVPGLPAPRPLQHRVRERFSEILKESFRRRVGRVHRPDERVDDGPRALRGPPRRGAWRSPTPTSRSWSVA